MMFGVQTSVAQSDLQIFGFAQARVKKIHGSTYMIANIPTPFGTQKSTFFNIPTNQLSSNVQQLNLFARKELSTAFTAWVNLEIVNSYSSDKTWGSLSLEEAWVSYSSSDAFTLKAGLLIPKFNHMNEIKNRMHILPYITRPLIYEASLAGNLDQTNYVPERAFLQVSGYVPVSEFTFEYSAFAGHAERAYINSLAANGQESGTDTVNFKTFGGRLGAMYKGFRAGVSATFDKDNQIARAGINEDVPRTRIGIDVGFDFHGFFFDGEYVGVALKPTRTTNNLNKTFCFATLGYDFTEQLYLYGSASFLRDRQSNTVAAGFRSYNVGAGYRPIESVVVKAEYSTYKTANTFPMQMGPTTVASVDSYLNYHIYQVAISVLF
jgi:hypothetical protein